MDIYNFDPQQILFAVLIICLLFIVVTWWIKKDIENCRKENYSPFRDTGGIFSGYTGYKYLDTYENQQYYKNNPWIYPTPTNYIREIFKDERENIKFLEEQRNKMLKNLKNVP